MDDAHADTLPDDIEALKAIVIAQRKERDAAKTERDALARKCDAVARHADAQARRVERLESRIEKIQAELLKLRKMYYGPRADRLTSHEQVAQLLLEFAGSIESRAVNLDDVLDEDRAAAAEAGREIRRIRPTSGGRRSLKNLDHLPERRVEHDLSEREKLCPCCGLARRRIGSDESWQVEFIPGHFERLVHVRHKYACAACDHAGEGAQIEAAPMTAGSRVIEKGMAGPGLLAYIVTSKFSMYTPLNRLEELFERSGLSISRGTQCVWCRDVADLVMPLYELMKARVKSSRVVQTDDTVMPMQAPDKVKQARMWVYIGDEDHPYDVYDFTLGRSRDGPMRFLKEFRGTLVADGYGGYDGVVVDNGLTRAGCWAHARRKFVDAQQSHPQIAAEATKLIGRMFEVESQIKGKSAAERARVRQTTSTELLARVHERVLAWQRELLPKHQMAEAINYALNQWDELSVFTRDERVPIDNNASERDMKRIVLNRKNSLFVGNERGGQTAAVLSSLTATCKRHGVDPQLYLTQLLVNIEHTPRAELDQWLPDEWKKTHEAKAVAALADERVG